VTVRVFERRRRKALKVKVKTEEMCMRTCRIWHAKMVRTGDTLFESF